MASLMLLPSIMSIERNKQIVKQLAEAHFRYDRQRVSEVLSPRLVWHHAGESTILGRDDYLAGLEMGRRAFSDMSSEVLHTVGEGDKVVTLSRTRMRHTGPFLGIEPTNREIEFPSLWMYRVVDERVVEIWSFDEEFTARLRGET
jgi:predicted ester cyclase